MDLGADMLLAHMPGATPQIAATDACPPFRRAFTRLPMLGRRAVACNVDRFLNRLQYYPRHARRVAHDFDAFHVIDHSYSQLLHALPARRAGVYCHDLDTFRCLLAPEREPRPSWFRAMARHILAGFRKAAVVFYSTDTVRRQIEQHGLVAPDRLIHAPYGAALEFTADAIPEAEVAIPVLGGRPFLLHVGSCIPRKRIDVLLDIFASVRVLRPDLRLVQVGGRWTDVQLTHIGRLGLAAAVDQVRGVSRHTLADMYRRAQLILQPSEAEGFGLPVVEALACGAGVIASDIPSLREVGGDAAVYCPVGDAVAWATTVTRMLDHPADLPDRATRLARAAQFSWANQARIIATAYLNLLHTGSPVAA
jgi:glycosyltransferase involved in cell wall biosynthesis